MVTVDRRLWLTRDDELVEDGDENAFRLWATQGQEVSAEEAERVGYKAKSAPENKAAASPPNKTDLKEDWIDYAVAQGMAADEAADLTKSELIEQFGG